MNASKPKKQIHASNLNWGAAPEYWFWVDMNNVGPFGIEENDDEIAI